MATGMSARNPIKNAATRLELSREALQHEWRTLTAKRNKAWSRGQEFAPDDDYRLRQVMAELNRWNK